MSQTGFSLRQIGVVRSSLKSREECPKQGWEGAPEAWVELDPTLVSALEGLGAGSEILLLTWFHQGRRDVLKVHPRGKLDDPERGVFSTRSPDRPNPVGLHRVEILELEGCRLRVRPLEALDGTPVVDIKPVLPQENAN